VEQATRFILPGNALGLPALSRSTEIIEAQTLSPVSSS
jgi:hypothetical protein